MVVRRAAAKARAATSRPSGPWEREREGATAEPRRGRRPSTWSAAAAGPRRPAPPPGSTGRVGSDDGPETGARWEGPRRPEVFWLCRADLPDAGAPVRLEGRDAQLLLIKMVAWRGDEGPHRSGRDGWRTNDIDSVVPVCGVRRGPTQGRLFDPVRSARRAQVHHTLVASSQSCSSQ